MILDGKGTRLRSVVNDRPKQTAVFGGRPFVEWLLLNLSDQGVRESFFYIGRIGEMIEIQVGDSKRWNIYCLFSRSNSFGPLWSEKMYSNRRAPIHF